MSKNIKKPIVKKKSFGSKVVSKPVVKKSEGAAPEKGGKNKYNLVRGMHDILPREEKFWNKCLDLARSSACHFQYGRIDPPVVEELALFTRSLGKGTDVVDKEMYSFESKDGEKLCLRPEATASIVRAFQTHGMWNLPQPVKLWYWGPMFRHDRPQAGRYRQFYQVGYEVFGGADPAVDAELILIAYNFCHDLGLPVEIHINSIGTLEERRVYLDELVNYYRSKRAYLCPDCRERISKNPLRLLDCKAAQCQPVKDSAPQMIDWLGSASKNHFTKVLEYLDDLEVPYVLRSTLVRGLDYYNNTVFEVYQTMGPDDDTNDETRQSALGGGGRYDGLVEIVGGKPTPAIGMALGVDRIIAAVKAQCEKNKLPWPNEPVDVFFAQLGDDARRVALRALNQFRNSGLNVAYNFFKNSLKAQLELANSFKVPFVVIFGQKEVQDKTAIIRDMESGVQEIVDQRKLEAVLKKKLGKSLV